jgi:hypothetical protein
VSGLLIRADRGEKVLRSVGEAPNGIVCIVVPDGTAAWAIDAAWQPPTVASLEHGGVITVDMPSENGMGQASTVVDVDDIVVACASGLEAGWLLALVCAACHATSARCIPELRFEPAISHLDLAVATRDSLERHGFLTREAVDG